MKINTPYGTRTVVRRIGFAGEYYLTAPTPAAPNGEWWILNPQTGFVSVPSNSRALVFAMSQK